MTFTILGKTSDGNVFVDEGTTDEQDERKLLKVLQKQKWDVRLYSKTGEFTHEEKSMIHSLLMAQTDWARTSLQQFGITPIA